MRLPLPCSNAFCHRCRASRSSRAWTTVLGSSSTSVLHRTPHIYSRPLFSPDSFRCPIAPRVRAGQDLCRSIRARSGHRAAAAPAGGGRRGALVHPGLGHNRCPRTRWAESPGRSAAIPLMAWMAVVATWNDPAGNGTRFGSPEVLVRFPYPAIRLPLVVPFSTERKAL
jgi:hypothetical protein